ncbi:MAG TPA: hypothetical protein VN774_09250, partial [Candidatus Limnocylindrales bacterium]|nr:hypothetical protein [Candidatus Limnocylindrales bacterium]
MTGLVSPNELVRNGIVRIFELREGKSRFEVSSHHDDKSRQVCSVRIFANGIGLRFSRSATSGASANASAGFIPRSYHGKTTFGGN